MYPAMSVKESDNFWMQRVVQVEDESAASVVIVGKQHTAGGHGVLRVVHAHGLLIGGEGGNQMPVRCG